MEITTRQRERGRKTARISRHLAAKTLLGLTVFFALCLTGKAFGGIAASSRHERFSHKQVRSETPRMDRRLVEAAKIAERLARPHSVRKCWRYVKIALLRSRVINSYPSSLYARSAGNELSRRYGFSKIKVNNPYKAPVGAVLVYGGRGPGHVEFRAPNGFVSDFKSSTPSPRPLIGVYVKTKI